MAAVEAEIHGDAATEGGFGTGLRAKLEGGGNPVEEPPAPRSPSQAIAAATPSDSSDVQALRAELSASLAREQELRTSLTDQLEVHSRQEADVVAELGARAAELDGRAAALSATEAAL